MRDVEELSDRVQRLEEQIKELDARVRFKTVVFGMMAGILAILAGIAVHYWL